ncbi:LOW QUALITY PROTEIN: transcription factor bHLH143-like [Salvia miltiorrhiza]|uniref:LOW QUALITY PROTEIN: transcription factor bHLH143-like n=1 Tax=Salvia miltiorrhiza TaxID=226208 RepID=UPI0025ACF7D4|nr:LOW QUALITY PROTEIN: transcription factor bHLH143-like [Salvia miltiorrhiza]
MEKHFGSGYDQHLLSSTLNLSGFPFTNGYLNMEPLHRYPYPVEDSTLRNLPPVPGSGFQQLKASEPNRLQNWFDHKQHFHQAFVPASNSASEQKFPAGLSDVERLRSPTIPGQKRFLVFDQSGDKTTLLYSSGVHTPVQFGASQLPNPPSTYNLGKEELRDSYYSLGLNDENFEDNSKDATEDEMHEDTEELDALLCSDDDSDFSEDEETSTGHSPSTMTDNGIPKLVEETGEEVDSFSVPAKRQKLLDGSDVAPSSRYDGSSLKTFAYSELESDAESSCGSRKEELYIRSGCKRSRKDKIHETVSILQSIIPDANGKDAIVVIDQAIHYLRSLKVKAKALGLDAL